MTNKRVTNLPTDIKPILDRAAEKAYDVHVDEKGTTDNPGLIRRCRSKLNYHQVWDIIKDRNPHNTVYWRGMWDEHWEFGSGNISGGGSYYIYILLRDKEAHEIFEEFGLTYEIY